MTARQRREKRRGDLLGCLLILASCAILGSYGYLAYLHDVAHGTLPLLLR